MECEVLLILPRAIPALRISATRYRARASVSLVCLNTYLTMFSRLAPSTGRSMCLRDDVVENLRETRWFDFFTYNDTHATNLFITLFPPICLRHYHALSSNWTIKITEKNAYFLRLCQETSLSRFIYRVTNVSRFDLNERFIDNELQ